MFFGKLLVSQLVFEEKSREGKLAKQGEYKKHVTTQKQCSQEKYDRQNEN